jgi:hypothetical protein
VTLCTSQDNFTPHTHPASAFANFGKAWTMCAARLCPLLVLTLSLISSYKRKLDGAAAEEHVSTRACGGCGHSTCVQLVIGFAGADFR